MKFRIVDRRGCYYVERERKFLCWKFWGNEFPANDQTTGYFFSEESAIDHLNWLKNVYYQKNKIVNQSEL